MKIRENPIGYLIMLVVVTLVAIAGCGPAVATPVYDGATTGATIGATTPKPTSPPPLEAAPPAGATTSQFNAVEKAESYLEFSGFSKAGLVKQLKFEGFSDADANYGVNNVTVDWMEQAVRKAKSYLETSAFSKAGLVKQLKYEGFTAAEATHGAEAAGL